MQIVAAEIKRPKTNLTVNPAFMLDKQQMKSAFMGIFTWAYSGDPRKTLLKVALAPLMSTVGIPLGKRPAAKTAEQRSERKAENQKLRNWETNRKSFHLNYFTKLKKVGGSDPHFVLHLPVFSFRDVQDIDSLFFMFSGVGLTDEARVEIEQMMESKGSHTFKPNQAISRAGLPGSTNDMLAPCLMGVEYEIGVEKIAYLVFKITQEEAQALVSMEWMEIRPVDMYPLFSLWVEEEYVAKNYSKSVTSLSKIAATLPKHDPADERIDEFGVGINLDGDPIWLPHECNATQRYESLFTSASAGTEGTFTMRSVNSPKMPALPANIPILVDWVNNKFTYSNSAGKPEIMPLEHIRKCNASMAMNILNRELPDKFMERLVSYAKQCNISVSPNSYGAMGSSGTINDFFNGVLQTKAADNWVPRYIDLTDDEDDDLLLPVRRFVLALYNAAIANIEALNATYAVSTVIGFLGMLTVIAKYGTHMAETRAKANTIREKAGAQGVDPNWTPPAMPLITKKFDTPEGGMLPHQGKIRNLMKDSPDFGVIAVDAGGGKSMLAITDALYEIKAGHQGPFLIMCPSHLVANYVSEVVEFTDGMVNVIPVTSFNVRITGFARYEAILKDAPVNTVLIVDYDVLRFRAKEMGYGTSSIKVNPVVDMIRQFRPGYCFLDESHFLRNSKSRRFETVMSLIADIPKKRIASGTLNPDSPSDLAGQMAMLDPTIFGSREEFNRTYGEDIRGNRVMKWRTKGQNSISQVLPKLKQSVVWAQAKRKEWACALPKRTDAFIGVDLTDNQRRLYDAIFDDMIQQIRKDAESNIMAKKLLEKLEGKKASAADEEDFGDLDEQGENGEEEDILDDVEDVGPALQPYLADIERFVTDPASHPYAKNGIILSNGERIPPLTGDDLKAPKAIALEKFIKDHLAKSESKVLVFVNYNQSAQSLFAAMPPELQECGILYTASAKTELVNKFKTDKSVKWMIGIRKSLEVGLNLQQAGCLIRCEGVWTPGEQEQGDSRIARPYFGPGGDNRKGLTFYTLVANRTIDITKAARLRAKMVALAKFENTGNPAYEQIEDIPIIPMNLATIRTKNDFETDLAQYQSSMAALNDIMRAENEEYKIKITREGGFHFTQVQRAETPKGAAILSRVPYAQGTELYKASELGLVRVDNYLGMELSEDEEDEGNGNGEEDGVESDEVAKQRALIMRMRCHCEFGDGIIIGAADMGGKGYISRLSVRLDDGTTVNRLRATNVFVVTRKETNSIDMRNKLAEAAGLKVTAPITVPGMFTKQTKMSVKEQRELERQKKLEERKAKKALTKTKTAVSIELQLQMVNGYMRLSYIGDDERTVRSLEALGFKLDQSHYFTRIRSYRHLLKQATMWAEAGFETSNQVDNDALSMLADELAKGGIQTHRHYDRLISKGKFNNYLRTIFKPNADKKLLNMFAMITDGGEDDPATVRQAEKVGAAPAYAVAYLCLPAGAGHPGSKLAISSKYKAPGTRWFISNPTLSLFVGSLAAAKNALTTIRDAGIQVTNVEELNKMAKSVRKVSAKNDTHVDVKDEE